MLTLPTWPHFRLLVTFCTGRHPPTSQSAKSWASKKETLQRVYHVIQSRMFKFNLKHDTAGKPGPGIPCIWFCWFKQAGNCISPEVQIIFYRFIIYTVYVRFEAYWKGFEADSNFHDCNCNLTVKLEGDASKIIVRLLSELLDDWKMPLTWHSY